MLEELARILHQDRVFANPRTTHEYLEPRTRLPLVIRKTDQGTA